MLGAGDVGLDRLLGEAGVHVGPHFVGVRHDLAVDNDFGGQGFVPVFGGEFECVAIDVGCKDDAVIADLNFDDVRHTVRGAGFNFGAFDLARGVCHVDCVLANTFTKTLQTRRGATGFNNRCREIEVFAKGFGNDGCIGQNSGGTGNLYLITRGSGGCGYGGNGQRGSGEFNERHDVSCQLRIV